MDVYFSLDSTRLDSVSGLEPIVKEREKACYFFSSFSLVPLTLLYCEDEDTEWVSLMGREEELESE